MEIQVIIPYGTKKLSDDTQRTNLGEAYNRLMESVDDWVCFLDHDILQVNPHWYHMCLAAVKVIGHRAGWITGVTNRIACPYQICNDAPKNDNIMAHMAYAKQRHLKHQANAHLVDKDKLVLPFSGFMILTHKKAWQDAGGFMDGFLGVDNNYHQKLLHKGYNTYVMPGLYMYHIYGNKTQWNQL
jgi:GT2 family glycosyltransferase